MAVLLTSLAGPRHAATGSLPGGHLVKAERFSGFGRYVDRVAVFVAGQEDRAALLIVSGVDAAVLGAVVAAVVKHAPKGMSESGVPASALSAESVHTVSRMRRDDRTPVRRFDGSAGWSVPGATVRVERWSVTITTGSAEVRIILGDHGWSAQGAAAVLDAALWQLVPEARHMTRTTPESGLRRLADVIPGAVGRDRGAGVFVVDRSSTAACSCGWTVTVDGRDMARAAARFHAESEQRKARAIVAIRQPVAAAH
jgi:hypothetical protein